MSDVRENNSNRSTTSRGIGRRSMIRNAAALSAGAAVAAKVAIPAWSTGASDRRLSIYEGKYAIDSQKIVDGYFAFPRGKAGLDVLVVMPGSAGVDDATRDLVRRHALAGKIAFVPDLRKTSGAGVAGRDAMIADFMTHTPRLTRLAQGNGTVTVVAA